MLLKLKIIHIVDFTESFGTFIKQIFMFGFKKYCIF